MEVTRMRMITCVARIKEGFTIAQAAQEVKEAFGKGGNPDAPIPEEFVGWVNTPPTPDGHFRCAFDAAYAQAMEYVQSIGGAVTCDIIAVEWEGQKMFQTGVDADGNPEWLGMISNCSVYQEPVEVGA